MKLEVVMKAKDVVVVFTSKSIKTMLAEGGSGNWRANEKKLCRCVWIVAVRNRHARRREGTEAHGSGFLIGQISGLKPSVNPEQPSRFVIAFDRYAELDLPNAWRKGHRNPVAYTTLGDLGIDLEKLRWKVPPNNGNATETKSVREDDVPSVLIAKARQMIAQSLSISPSAVKISVEF
jgi:hypothetical protein